MTNKHNSNEALQEMRDYGYAVLSQQQFYRMGAYVVKGPENYRHMQEGASEELTDEPHHII
jgi:biotin operon repressor